jgi:hypothetical protein
MDLLVQKYLWPRGVKQKVDQIHRALSRKRRSVKHGG